MRHLPGLTAYVEKADRLAFTGKYREDLEVRHKKREFDEEVIILPSIEFRAALKAQWEEGRGTCLYMVRERALFLKFWKDVDVLTKLVERMRRLSWPHTQSVVKKKRDRKKKRAKRLAKSG